MLLECRELLGIVGRWVPLGMIAWQIIIGLYLKVGYCWVLLECWVFYWYCWVLKVGFFGICCKVASARCVTMQHRCGAC